MTPILKLNKRRALAGVAGAFFGSALTEVALPAAHMTEPSMLPRGPERHGRSDDWHTVSSQRCRLRSTDGFASVGREPAKQIIERQHRQ